MNSIRKADKVASGDGIHDELLTDLLQLYSFLRARTFIVGERETVMDMVRRYQNPPLTLHRIVAMQMTQGEYQELERLLERIAKATAPVVKPDA